MNADQARIKVVVPGNPGVGYGFRLTEDNLYAREMDPKDLPIDYISPDDIDQYLGKTVRSFVDEGQLLKVSDITDFAMQDIIDKLIEAEKKIQEAIQKLQFCKDRCDDDYQRYIRDIYL